MGDSNPLCQGLLSTFDIVVVNSLITTHDFFFFFTVSRDVYQTILQDFIFAFRDFQFIKELFTRELLNWGCVFAFVSWEKSVVV